MSELTDEDREFCRRKLRPGLGRQLCQLLFDILLELGDCVAEGSPGVIDLVLKSRWESISSST